MGEGLGPGELLRGFGPDLAAKFFRGVPRVFRKCRTTLFSVVTVMALSLTACGGAKPAAPEQKAPAAPAPAAGAEAAKLTPLSPAQKLWVAEDGSPSGAGFYIAHAKGYFKELGLEVDIKPFESSGDMLPAIASGEIDVAGGITGANLFNAVARGLEIRIIADKGTNNPGKSYFNMVVRKDLADQIKDYKDLKGKKIGVFSVGTLNEYTVEKALAKGGLTTKDVELIPLGPPDMNLALANKSIEVGMQIEPMIAQAEQKGIAVRFKDTTEFLPGGQIAVVLASPKFANNKAVAERFMVAYLKGLRDYNDAFIKGQNTDAIIDILSKYSELKDKEVWKAVKVTGLNPNGAVFKDNLVDQYNWYKAKGSVKADVSLDKMIDLSLVDAAKKHVGDYK